MFKYIVIECLLLFNSLHANHMLKSVTLINAFILYFPKYMFAFFHVVFLVAMAITKENFNANNGCYDNGNGLLEMYNTVCSNRGSDILSCNFQVSMVTLKGYQNILLPW